MTNEVTYPGKYILKNVMVYPVDGSLTPLDISGLIPKFTIVESMKNDSIRGSMDVLDTVGVLEQYPLRGEERINLEVEDVLGNNKIYDLFLYRIDNVTATEINDGLYYRMHFVSYKRFESDKHKIIKAYETTVSDIVSDVFSNYYLGNNGFSASPFRGITNEMVSNLGNVVSDIQDVVGNITNLFGGNSSGRSSNIIGGSGVYVEDQREKSIVVEPTEGPLRLIIPNFTPTRTMKFLESRAYSTASPSCSFRFFESSNAFYFVSDEYIFNNGTEYDFTYSESIPSTPDYFDVHMNNFFNLTNSERFDTFNDLHGGGYHNKVITIDILRRNVNLKDPPWKYTENRRNYQDLSDEESLVDRHTTNFINQTFTDETAKQFLIVKDYDDQSGGQLRGEQHFPDIVSNRLAYRHHLNSIVLNTKGHGRLDITCGDVVNMDIREFDASSNVNEVNKQLSGRYIVEEVVHMFDKDISENHYKLLKRNWSEVVSSGLGTGPQ